MTNQLVTDSSFVRRPGPGRNTDFFGVQLLNFLNAGPIIPPDNQLRAQFTEVLNQVICERVVVIQDQNHKICSARSIARKVAIALLTLSWYSSSGSESATTPPPACTYAVPSFRTTLRSAIQESSWPSKPKYPTAPA